MPDAVVERLLESCSRRCCRGSMDGQICSDSWYVPWALSPYHPRIITTQVKVWWWISNLIPHFTILLKLAINKDVSTIISVYVPSLVIPMPKGTTIRSSVQYLRKFLPHRTPSSWEWSCWQIQCCIWGSVWRTWAGHNKYRVGKFTEIFRVLQPGHQQQLF